MKQSFPDNTNLPNTQKHNVHKKIYVKNTKIFIDDNQKCVIKNTKPNFYSQMKSKNFFLKHAKKQLLEKLKKDT